MKKTKVSLNTGYWNEETEAKLYWSFLFYDQGFFYCFSLETDQNNAFDTSYGNVICKVSSYFADNMLHRNHSSAFINYFHQQSAERKMLNITSDNQPDWYLVNLKYRAAMPKLKDAAAHKTKFQYFLKFSKIFHK